MLYGKREGIYNEAKIFFYIMEKLEKEKKINRKTNLSGSKIGHVTCNPGLPFAE